MKISDEAFHQWKQNDCTVSLLKLIEDLIEVGKKSITGHILGSQHVDIELLNIYKGEILGFNKIQRAILDKETLELDREGEDEVE